jgi:hypothetical protein
VDVTVTHTIAPTIEVVDHQHVISIFKECETIYSHSSEIVAILDEVDGGKKHSAYRAHTIRVKAYSRSIFSKLEAVRLQQSYPESIWLKRVFDGAYAHGTIAKMGRNEKNMSALLARSIEQMVGLKFGDVTVLFEEALKPFNNRKPDVAQDCYIFFRNPKDAAKAKMLDIFHEQRWT